jgi:glycerol kinase
MGELLLVIDEGTTSTRAMLFEPSGKCLGSQSAELTQHYPGPGLVEHDAAEIWERSFACAAAMVEQAGGPDAVAAIGITNQRETIVFWDKVTGEPLAPAIVWQDRRTAALCRRLREAGEEPALQARTGLLLDPYFSGTKIAWAMEHWPQLREAGDRLAIGTVESWLVWKLSGLHVTDATNASRTLLMGLGSGGWNDSLLDMFAAPRAALPEIVDCAGRFAETRLFGGAIPICGLAGDQQAATIGQACLTKGETKATYGTGAFILTNAGTTPPSSKHRLLATVLWQLGGRRTYAIEGAVFVAGSLIQWLRDSLGLVANAAETEALARSVPDSGGVFLVPALSGLGAPWWEPEARRAGGDGAPEPRPEDRLRCRRRGLVPAAGRRGHGHQRLDRPGPRRCARNPSRPAGFRGDDGAWRGDAGGGWLRDVRESRRSRADAGRSRRLRTCHGRRRANDATRGLEASSRERDRLSGVRPPLPPQTAS